MQGRNNYGYYGKGRIWMWITVNIYLKDCGKRKVEEAFSHRLRFTLFSTISNNCFIDVQHV